MFYQGEDYEEPECNTRRPPLPIPPSESDSQQVMPCTINYCYSNIIYHMGHDATKPVLHVSVKARFKPVSSATETI